MEKKIAILSLVLILLILIGFAVSGIINRNNFRKYIEPKTYTRVSGRKNDARDNLYDKYHYLEYEQLKSSKAVEIFEDRLKSSGFIFDRQTDTILDRKGFAEYYDYQIYYFKIEEGCKVQIVLNLFLNPGLSYHDDNHIYVLVFDE